MNNRKKTFAIIFTGETFSLITSSLVQFALIRYLTDTTGSATVLAIATILGFLPQILLGPFIGVFVDRRDRKKILIFSDIGIALATLLLALAFFVAPETPIFLIYIALTIRSFGNAFYQPAMQASVPLLVPEEKIVTIGGISQSIISLSAIIGTILGGILYAIWSIEAIVLLDVVGAVIGVISLCLVKIPSPKKVSTENPNILREMKEGLVALRENKIIFLITKVIFIGLIIVMPMSALFPLMTKNYFGLGSVEASMVEMAFGIGMFLGGLLLSIWGGFKKKQYTIFIAWGLAGLFTFLCGLVPVSRFIAYVIGCGLMGAMMPLLNTPYMAILQTSIAPEKLGRVMSLISSAFLVAMPLGLVVATPVSNTLGVEYRFIMSGLGVIALSVYALFNPKIKKAEL